MKQRRNENRRTAISIEAAEWFVRLKDDDMNARDRRIFLAWLKESPMNIAELLRLRETYRHVRIAKLASAMFIEKTDSNVIELAPHETLEPDMKIAEIDRQAGRSHWRVAATIAVFAASIFLATIVKIAWLDNLITTGASEWRHMKLDDGSIVRVGPRSRLHVDFGDEQRSIKLSRGEVYFQVAKDEQRPFVVRADSTVVRAVGTEFAVSRMKDTVLITVSEGTVSVMRNGGATISRVSDQNIVSSPELRPISVTRGEQITVAQVWPAPIHKVNVQHELAWAEGKLIFEGSTVAKAVTEFNRLNRVQIVIEDQEIATRPVAFAVFDAADPESFAETVALDAHAELVKDGRDTLRLIPKVENDEEHQPIVTKNSD
jgi:transmembrane sensor